MATQALGRKTDFDPNLDPIVRIQSGRLRLGKIQDMVLIGKVFSRLISCWSRAIAAKHLIIALLVRKRRKCKAYFVEPEIIYRLDSFAQPFCSGT
jgi:hypothetical protein